MGSLFWLAASLGLAVYGFLVALPFFSSRRQIVANLGRLARQEDRTSPFTLGPQFWLQSRRKGLITRSYPDMLSHLANQTSAGAGILHAFVSLPPILQGPLRSEVEDLIADMRISPLPAALQRFAERCDTPEIRTFVRYVIYQQSLGIDLPQILQSEEIHFLALQRQRMRQRIQRTAATMSAVTILLLLNGLLICLFPLFDEVSKLMVPN